jgi:cytochrome c
MRIPFSLLLALGLSVGASAAAAQAPSQERPYGIGAAATHADLHEMDISISPDGKELPPGRGTAQQGAKVFSERRCSVCHGPNGKEGPGPRLVYEPGEKLPTRIAAYYPPSLWPFAPSLWDFISRAMPFDQAGWLSPDEVYAVTAFVLYRNGIIGETDVMDAKTLPQVKMPNRAAYDPSQTDWKPTPRGFVFKP